MRFNVYQKTHYCAIPDVLVETVGSKELYQINLFRPFRLIQKILKYVAFESQKYAVRLRDNCGCPTLFREYRNFPNLISGSEDFEESQLLVFLF